MPYCHHDKIRIHYQVFGLGQPLVLQHGTAGCIAFWQNMDYIASLAKRFQVIAIDARGHGKSDKPHSVEDYSLKHRVDDVIAVVDDLNIPKFHYFGYSMGAWIGFGLANDYNDKLLTLALGGGSTEAENMELLRWMARDEFKTVLANNSLPKSFKQALTNNDWLAIEAACADRPDIGYVEKKLTMPCFLFCGTNDPRIACNRALALQIDNVTLLELENLDHLHAITANDVILNNYFLWLDAQN